jgi:methyltransferase (TIGR00027 family)
MDYAAQPDSTAVRTALWRAMHVLVDSPPHVLEDEVGLRLAEPGLGWRGRPDMDPHATRGIRAGMVARARLIEDLVAEQFSSHAVQQYVLLGAGLDTFAQRRPELASHLTVFEVDRPEPQVWKRRRLIELGLGLPEWLRLVPVDFETSGSWLAGLTDAGFKTDQPAVVASTGVSMYLTREASAATLQQVAGLGRGSTLVSTFLVPAELIPADERPVLEAAEKGARASGTPFVSFFTPDDMLALARDSGFRHVQHLSPADLAQRYFAGRSDGLRPGSGEDYLIAST